MRRLSCIAAFALLLTVPVWAQRGGGHGGGGGHPGVAGGHGGGFGGRAAGSFGGGHMGGGSRSFSGYRGGMGFSHPQAGVSSGFSHRPFLHDGFRNHGPGNWGFRHRSFHTYGFRNYCYGWRCGWRGSRWGWGYGYPWWGSAYYDPWWWWNQDDQKFDEDYYRQYEIANEMNQQSLDEQRMRREEEQGADQDAYVPRRPEHMNDPGPAQEAQGQQIISPTVLVFRDQHREEVQNYAIVGSTLWNFAPGHTQKIALADLNLPATEKANDDRGLTFQVPRANEGQ